MVLEASGILSIYLRLQVFFFMISYTSDFYFQLTREKELLQEMMRHLHMKPNDKNSSVAEVQKPV